MTEYFYKLMRERKIANKPIRLNVEAMDKGKLHLTVTDTHNRVLDDVTARQHQFSAALDVMADHIRAQSAEPTPAGAGTGLTAITASV